jgi:hypothetical protein
MGVLSIAREPGISTSSVQCVLMEKLRNRRYLHCKSPTVQARAVRTAAKIVAAVPASD